MIACSVGWVVRTFAETVHATLPGARVGEGVRMWLASGASIEGEVAAVERARVTIVPFGALRGIAVGDRVESTPDAGALPLGFSLLGRAIDATGLALDDNPTPLPARPRWFACEALSPAARTPIDTALWTGVRAIDGLLTLGRGARIGIFGAPGVGKTSLLERIVSDAQADAFVVALVGERGREAQRWFERIDRRTTVVCATSDRSAAERIRAAEIAMAQAQTLCEGGLDVVMLLDSLARYAAALRERHVALGEPVGRGGYPPTVWAALARYLERAGNAAHGSITLLATVLSDGADERDPLSESARSLLDGHLRLSHELARAGHFPAIDVPASTSRTMSDVVASAHAADARIVREALALLDRTNDARAFGLAAGIDPALARAVASQSALMAFLRQTEAAAPWATRAALRSLAVALEREPHE